MTNLKRSAIATVLTLALASGLAACGNNSEDAKPAEAAPSVSPSVSPNNKEAKDNNASGSGKESAKPKPSASPSPKGPYKPATPKRPAQNVPVPGPLPEVAKEKSKAGQVAFIEHWTKEFNYGLETGKMRPEFWEITSKSCDYCKGVQESLELISEDRSWNIGGGLTMNDIRPDLITSDNGNYEVGLSITGSARKRYIPGKTKPVEQYPEITLEEAFVELRRVNGKWQMEGLYQLEN